MRNRRQATLQGGEQNGSLPFGLLLLVCTLAVVTVSSLIGNFVLGVVWLDRDDRTATQVQEITKERDRLQTAIDVLHSENAVLRDQIQTSATSGPASDDKAVSTAANILVDRQAIEDLERRLSECDAEQRSLEESVNHHKSEAAKFERRLWELSMDPDILPQGSLGAALEGFDAVSTELAVGPDPRLKDLRQSIEEHFVQVATHAQFEIRSSARDRILATVSLADSPDGNVVISASVELVRNWRVPGKQLAWGVTLVRVADVVAVPPSRIASAVANLLTRLVQDLAIEVRKARGE